jgi:hypothetical protein
MPPINDTAEVVIGGQSQAIMALSGGGETVDDPMAGQPVAATRLQLLLSTAMPGVTVNIRGGSNSTAWADTALFEEYRQVASEGIWNGAASTPRAKATSWFNTINANAGASKLCVVVHWTHSTDFANANSNWSDADYATWLGQFYDAMHAACAGGFARFFILPLVIGSRLSGDEPRVAAGRRSWEALAGGRPWQGLVRRPFMLWPVYEAARVPRGAYVDGSGDFLHVIRSAAWRNAAQLVPAIAGINGVVTPQVGQGALCRAVRINATTVRAFFVSPQRLPLRRQGTAAFTLTGGGSITAQAPPDNSAVASTGYATMDLTVNGIGPLSRLHYNAEFGAYTEFVNGRVPPRGLLQRALFFDPTAGMTIGENAEDVLFPDPIMHVGANQAGVAIEQ